MRKTMVTFAAILLLVVGSRARAGAVLTFDKPGFEWSHPAGNGSPYHVWDAGDYWAQNFTGTGIASAESMALHLKYDHNTLGETLNMKVLLNDGLIGTFDIEAGDDGYDGVFSLGAIAGPDFRIQLEATNTIGSGMGAVSLRLGDSYATLTGASVPEPSAIALAGSALMAGAVVGLRRRCLARVA